MDNSKNTLALVVMNLGIAGYGFYFYFKGIAPVPLALAIVVTLVVCNLLIPFVSRAISKRNREHPPKNS
jgi:hypothetical protein